MVAPNPGTDTINTLAALPFRTLIGGPLNAAIEAQALAAKTTVDFIKAIGFEPSTTTTTAPASAQFGKVRNVVFSYEIGNADGSTQNATLTVPILTIIPIPYIRIDEMTIDFTAKISEQHVHKNNESDTEKDSDVVKKNGDYGVGALWWGVKGSVSHKASFSSKHTQSSSSSSKYQVECTVNVHVRAVQDDMPAGLSRVLTILSDSITAKKELPAPAALPATTSG